MSNPVWLHYVHRRYLENFSEKVPGSKKDVLYVISLFDLEKNILRPNNYPDKIFKKDHLYPDEMEKYFCQVEWAGIAVIRKIINKDKISSDERRELSLYMAIQKMRTLSAKQQHEDIATSAEVNRIKTIINNPEKLVKIVNHLESSWSKDIEEIKRDPNMYFQNALQLIESWEIFPVLENSKESWAHIIAHLIPQMSMDYCNADWHILRCGVDNEFVTSDNPLVTMNFSDVTAKNGVISKRDVRILENTFPLDAKTLLLMSINGRRGFFDTWVNENWTSVRELNSRTTAFAHRFIAWKNNLLLSSLGKKFWSLWRYRRSATKITPDKPEWVPQLSWENTKHFFPRSI